jgi:ATP-dependent Lon protease
MTGEITLRGTVLPIGGVREKILAAKRNGITSVILPKENKVDVDELAEWARDGMTFNFVSNVDEVFNMTLDKKDVK